MTVEADACHLEAAWVPPTETVGGSSYGYRGSELEVLVPELKARARATSCPWASAFRKARSVRKTL